MSISTPKLYYSPISCGAAPFIIAYIAHLKMDFEQVNIRTHITASGADYYTINPKGNVPALIIGDVLLNETTAILQWCADQNPSSKLAPAAGTIERYQLQNHLNYIASEVHTSFGALFKPAFNDEARDAQVKKVDTKLDYLENHVLKGGKQFLLGDHFTIADAYLYIVLSWLSYVNITLDKHPNVSAYYAGIKALPNVVAAHQRMAELPAAP